jgi:hypothetical protein
MSFNLLPRSEIKSIRIHRSISRTTSSAPTCRLAISCGCQWAADLFLLALKGTEIHPELVDELLRHHQEMIAFGLIDPQMDLRAYATGRVSAAIQQARILGDLPQTRSRIKLRLDEDGAIDVLPIDQG